MSKNARRTREGIGRLIREERSRAGLSQRELAERVGIVPTYVSHLESGRKEPSLMVLAKIARALGKRLVVRMER